ncbi:MAG: PilZ domain-containing protein [Spirochaetaceae bacterium]
MGLLTKQDIDDFYDKYRSDEVIITKKISQLFGFQPKHIYFKFKDIQRPCIVYSSSMTQAKVIANLPKDILQKVKNENIINLRYAINNEDKKNDSLFFFIKCKISEITDYKPEQNLYILQFKYTSKPPEPLIIILGRLLEAKRNSKKRADERIIIDKNNISKLGLNTSAVQIMIDNIPRQGMIRDLSFNGMKFLLAGNAKFLNNKAIKVELHHKDFGRIILLGKSIRSEALANRKDIVAMAVQFDINQIQLEYHLMINEFLKSQKVVNKIKSNIKLNQQEQVPNN